jgi:hypothetical protein
LLKGLLQITPKFITLYSSATSIDPVTDYRPVTLIGCKACHLLTLLRGLPVVAAMEHTAGVLPRVPAHTNKEVPDLQVPHLQLQVPPLPVPLDIMSLCPTTTKIENTAEAWYPKTLSTPKATTSHCPAVEKARCP